MMLTVGSLFAGVGGFDLGMEQAGFKVLWQAEWDKHCQSILRRHWPDCALYGDVTDVNGAEIAPVDVITFGSPCQDLSVAGKRAGLDGDRSSMLFQAIRIIKEMRDATDGTFPRIAIWENVPGALSSNRGADFGVVLDSLADVGAVAIEWAVLDAQHFGVPQRRRRIFVVAVFDPSVAERCSESLLPVAEGRRRHSAKSKSAREEIAGTLGGGSGSRGWSPDTDRMTFVPETTGTLTSGGHPGSYNGQDAYNDLLIPFVKSRRAKDAQSVAQPYSFDTQFGSNANVFTDLSPTLKATQASPSVALPVAFSVREDAKANTFSVTPTDVSLCLTGLVPSPQSHHAQLFIAHPLEYAVRRLTPLECERLMGWPDEHTRWTDDGREQADSHRYRQCGNGVATPVAMWIGQQIVSLLEQPS